MAKRQREGRGKCETFDFLGFTHICGKTFKHKRFILNRITIAKRMRRTLAAIKEPLERRRHDPLGKTGRWLAQVYRGWQGYYGVPNNGRRLQQLLPHRSCLRLVLLLNLGFTFGIMLLISNYWN